MARNRITYGDELVLRDGKVGIGTTDPKANLSVFGSLDVSGDLRIVSAGATEGEIITQKHYRDNGGSIVYQSGDQHLFSVSNEGDLAYVINDSDGNASLTVSNDGETNIRNIGVATGNILDFNLIESNSLVINDSDGNASLTVSNDGETNIRNIGVATGNILDFNLIESNSLVINDDVSIGSSLSVGATATINSIKTPEVNFISTGNTITAKHYSDNNGSVVYQSGESNLFSIDNDSDVYYSINDSEAKSALTVSSTGITTIRDLFPNTVNFTSAGSSESENIQLNHYRNIAYQPAVGVSTDNRGAISFDSSSGITTDGVTYSPASLFSLTNGGGNIFSVRGYTKQSFGGSEGSIVLDVTQDGKIGIGTTNPLHDVHIVDRNIVAPNSSSTLKEINVLGIVTSSSAHVNTVRLATGVDFTDTLNPAQNTFIRIESRSTGISSQVPTGGAALFTGDLEQNLDGGQLFTVVNDNYSLFKINHFVGVSSLAPGERNIVTTFDVLSNGNIGFGTTNPIYGIDIQKELRIKNDILLTTQNSPTLDNTIFATAVDAGINTSSPVNGSFVLSKNQRNSGANSSQLFTVENNNNSNFRLNIVGIAQTYLPSGQVPIFPAFDISNYGEVRIFDTLTKSGDGFRPLPTGISTLAPNDADLFRIDSYAPTFIGSFPTINPAIRVNKFGYTEIYRNINQVSGITTVGIATTTPTLSVNATLSFELVNNTTLSIKVRGTDGVTRSGIVTLS
jgi:hypothetical protein